MNNQKVNHLLEQFEKTKTFKRFFSTLLHFDEDLDCFVATEKWRDKEAELLTAAWWMFSEVAKIQAVPEGFVLVPKELSDEKADIQASLSWSCHLGLFKSQNRDMSTTEIEEFRLRWCRNKARDLQEEYKAMIEAQEQSHE